MDDKTRATSRSASMTVVFAPDSFKGTVSAVDAARHLAGGWASVRPDDRLVLRPTADGGEGTIDALTAAHPGSLRHTRLVTGPDGRPVEADWLLLPDGTAVVEAAQTSGLPLMSRLDATGAGSLGLGELLSEVAGRVDVSRVLVALGGTACTDGGAGALIGLGARLVDDRGVPVPAGGAGLSTLDHVDLTSIVALPADGVSCLVDVTAPLLGPHGAARQFAPQKGADQPEVMLLDAALARWSDLLGGDPDAPGAGAAGGLGFGLASGWGARLEDGAAMIAEEIGLSAAIATADVVVTGEGRFDDQSLRGKVVGHLLDLAGRGTACTVVVAGSAASAAPGGTHLIQLARSSPDPPGRRWAIPRGGSTTPAHWPPVS